MSEAAAEFADYVEDDAGMAYIASATFEERCNHLFNRLGAGDEMTAADAAELIGLPVGVFRFLFASYLAASLIAMGEPATGSLH